MCLKKGWWSLVGRRATTWTLRKPYDAVNDTWKWMPNMIKNRFDHSLVAVKNKLFVIGYERFDSCEVFDSSCDRFVFLKKSPNFNNNEALTIGSKVLVPQYDRSHIDVYDVINEEWTWKYSEATSNVNLFNFFCVKVPVCEI